MKEEAIQSIESIFSRYWPKFIVQKEAIIIDNMK